MSTLHMRLSCGSRRKSLMRAASSASTSALQAALKPGSSRCCSRHSIARECPGSMSAQNCATRGPGNHLRGWLKSYSKAPHCAAAATVKRNAQPKSRLHSCVVELAAV